MIVIVCVDDQGGTMFNHRRQSQDSVLRKRILTMTASKRLWVSTYSAKQFSLDEQRQLSVSNDYLDQAGNGDYCLVEGVSLIQYEKKIEKIILFKWNRVYPSDTFFDIPLMEHGWKSIESIDFLGNSHEKITEEVYQR